MNFLNEVCQELLEPRKAPAPLASLSSAEASAVGIAKSWTHVILHPSFLPPEEAVYAPFYGDDSRFDILRVWYTTELGEVLIAQTLCVFCLVLRGGPRDVNAMARRIFRQKDRIRLKTLGTEGGVSYGAQPAPAEDGHRDWVGHLRWWTDGETLGFLTLKKGETPGKGLMGWGAELNRYWFRPYRQEG